MAKLITVFGATGRQGGGVAKALLKSGRPGFKVRAVTRNASSDKAKALQAKGAEVVTASLDDPSTLGPALRGAHGVFAVTNYWEHMDKEREIKQGKAIADAAKAAGVLHVVFSGLENVQKIAGFPCPVFDGKAEIEEYMTSIELPVTFVRYPSYYENFIGSLKPQKQDDGTYVLGIQGGSVANALLEDRDFKVRAVTRNASSDKAKALQAKGAEVATADLDDPSTLGPALQGTHGVFVVTNYWEYLDKEREIKQGKAIADAAKAAGVLHVVFSGGENVQKIAGFPCPHFDAKGQIEEYMTSIELPVTFARFSFYYENYISALKPQILEDGTYILGVPMEGAEMDAVSAADTVGPAVRAIFQNRSEWLGRTVGFSGDRLTIQQHAEILSKHLAPKVFKATDMTAEAFAQLGFPGADDLGNMFKFYRLHNPDRSVELTRQLHPAAKSFDTWVAENKEALLKALD